MVIKINATLKDGLPYMTSPYQNKEIGTMWDSGIQELKFVRSGQLDDYDMLLLFRPGNGEFYEQNIGTGNSYVLNNALTQKPELTLQVAFIKDDTIRFGSNRIVFKFRTAEQNGSIPESIPSEYTNLLTSAFVECKLENEIYTFYNINGEKVFEMSSGDGVGFTIGDVTTETLPENSEATGELIYEGSKINLKFGIPAGKTGEKGDSLFSMSVDETGNLYADYISELTVDFSLDESGNLYINTDD